jgi:diguanylate cyclase
LLGQSIVVRTQMQSKGGDIHWVEIHAGPYRTEQGTIDGIAASFRLVDAEVSSQRILERRARTDELTGLLNRRGLLDGIEQLAPAVQARGQALALLMIDLDHFKKVNDTHGHLMGDRVIQALGEILRSAVTGANHSAARYGGEEFALLLSQTSLDKSIELAETVRNRTKAMKIRNRTTQEVLLTVTISGGVTAMKPDDDAASLISRADAALYAAKNSGRDRVVTHA